MSADEKKFSDFITAQSISANDRLAGLQSGTNANFTAGMLRDFVKGQTANEEVTSDGANVLTTQQPYQLSTLRLFRNGVRVKPSQFISTGAKTIGLLFTPDAGDEFLIEYNY